MSLTCWGWRGWGGGDSLHAADLVSCVKVFNVEEVQQHLRHVVVLIDDVLASKQSDDYFFLIIS